MSVGFEYESCLNVVLWERRSSTLQGFELDASNMGSWTLDKHHILDVQNGEMLLHFVLVTLCFVLLTALVFGSVWDIVSSEVAVELLRGQLHGLTMNIQAIVKNDLLPHLHTIEPGIMAQSNGRLNEVPWRSVQNQKNVCPHYGPA